MEVRIQAFVPVSGKKTVAIPGICRFGYSWFSLVDPMQGQQVFLHANARM